MTSDWKEDLIYWQFATQQKFPFSNNSEWYYFFMLHVLIIGMFSLVFASLQRGMGIRKSKFKKKKAKDNLKSNSLTWRKLQNCKICLMLSLIINNTKYRWTGTRMSKTRKLWCCSFYWAGTVRCIRWCHYIILSGRKKIVKAEKRSYTAVK